MQIPKLDLRDEEEIYNQIVKLARSYVPEWNIKNDNEDAGVVFSKVFSYLFAETINRFNKVPYKNLIYFMNLLGADTLGCISSKGYATVLLNNRTVNGVEISKGTRLFSSDEDGERILFEIKDDVLALDNEVEAVYCENARGDIIVKPYTAEERINNKSFGLFDFYGYENIQKYKFSIAESSIFLTGGKIVIDIINTIRPYSKSLTASILANADYAQWKYLTYEGWKDFNIVFAEGNRIEIIVSEEIPYTNYMDKLERWICCEIKNISNEISFTGLNVCSINEDIEAEALYCNDLALVGKDFLPFNESFGVYDSFYIKSNEVFSKKGAKVTFEFIISSVTVAVNDFSDLLSIKWKRILNESEIRTPEPSNIYVEKVIWEYWNGDGWIRLFKENLYEDFFKIDKITKKSIEFICPDDIEPSFVGAEFGLWIRARILKVNNTFRLNSNYISPLVAKMSLSYNYDEIDRKIEQIYVEKDLQKEVFNDIEEREIILSKSNDLSLPITYFAFDRKLKGGPIKIYFSIDEINSKHSFPLKWEYWGKVNGKCKWIELKIVDETDWFKQSGIVTFICRDNFERLNLFSEDMFWIRVINTDGSYERKKTERPKINNILFNTVKIEQKETVDTEYFYIDRNEANKKCYLNNSNVLDEDVWVNERERLIGDEINASQYSADPNVEIKSDEKGIITEYWVKWKRVGSFDNSAADDRVYRFDKKNNCVVFGNGIRGKIPYSSDRESIKINYSICAGNRGNIKPFSIEGFADAVAFVGRVYNYEAINGGCDGENIEDAVQRSMQIVKCRDRIVSLEDYAIIAKAADRNIVKIKVAEGIDERGMNSRGSIVIAVLPRVPDSYYSYFDEIKNNIINELSQKASVIAVASNKIKITEVTYIEFNVNIKVRVESYNDYQEVYKQIERRLEKYFNPISGNFNSDGFEIGALPNKMKIYNYIKNIEKIKIIESINIFCFQKVREYKKEIDYEKIFFMPFAVPLNGTHNIEIDVY